MTKPHSERPENPLISLVVPVFNEAEAIPVFLAETRKALAGLRLEIVFVNDGSADGTLAALQEKAARDERLVVVNLSRNFGKEAALTAGLQVASGDAVVPIDVDLQDPPELIHRFIEKWRDGYDVAYGLREDRSSDELAKRKTAAWFYAIFNQATDTPIPVNTGDFRLMDRRVVDALNLLPERVRFTKGLFAWVGFNAAPVPYVRPVRSAGSSKFNARRLWRLALDGVFSFSSAPLRIWSYVGAVIAGGAGIYAVWIIAKTLALGRDMPGYPSLMTVVLFLGGIQLVTLGIIGEYLSRMFVEMKGRPIYIIESITRHAAEESREQRAEGEPGAP